MAGELRKILNRINLNNYRARHEKFEKVINLWESIDPKTVTSADLSSCDGLLRDFNFDESAKTYYKNFLNPTMLFIKLLLNIIHGSKQPTFAHEWYMGLLGDLEKNVRVSVYCKNAIAELKKFVEGTMTAATLENNFRKTISNIRKTVLDSLNTMYEAQLRMSLKTFLGPRGMQSLQDFATKVNMPGSDLRSSLYDRNPEVEMIKENEEAIEKLNIIVDLMSKIYRPTDANLVNLKTAIEKCKERS